MLMRWMTLFVKTSCSSCGLAQAKLDGNGVEVVRVGELPDGDGNAPLWSQGSVYANNLLLSVPSLLGDNIHEDVPAHAPISGPWWP